MEDMEIAFFDRTIIETGAIYEKVSALVDMGMKLENWLIESNFVIAQGFSESMGVAQFWKNGEVILTSFSSGFKDKLVPVDVIFLYEYLKERGWNLIPNDKLVEEDLEYWEKFYSIIEENNYSDEKDTKDSDGKDKNKGNDNNSDDDDDNDGYNDNIEDKINQTKEYKKPTANRYKITDLPDFKTHKYDYERREKAERENKF